MPPRPGAEPPPIDPDVYARRWRTLGVLCLSLTIVMVGNSSLNVALPTMARELDASPSALQWMVDSYALVFAGLLFTAGTLGDRFGRKGALQGGLVVFLAGAAVATTADSAGTVIGARAVMGVAAAFVMPSTLSILTTVFPPHERARAISFWAGIAAGGAALGPPTTGFLLEHFWWGSVFLVNVPLVLLALVAGRRLVPTSRDPEHHALDLIGALLSIAGIGGLVYGIIEGPVHGWGSTTSLATFAGAVVVLALFGWREHTARHPMLDLRLFRDRRFSVASLGISVAFFAMFGTFFLTAQYVQLALGYSPLASGLLLLPMPLTMMTVAPQAPKLVARWGPATVVPVGMLLVATGLVAYSRLGAESPVGMIYFALIPMAGGMALTMTPLTTLIMASVPPGSAGVGSAMNDTTRELGGALGVAVLGSVLTSQFASSLRPALDLVPEVSRAAASAGLTGALEVAGGLPGAAGEALDDAARRAFVDGLGVANLVAAGLVVVAAATARALLPRRTPAGGGPPAVPPAPGGAAGGDGHPSLAATSPDHR